MDLKSEMLTKLLFLTVLTASLLGTALAAEQPRFAVYIMRHLNVDLTQKGDFDLNDEGRANATRLVAWFDGKPLVAIFVSTWKRTKQTAAPLAIARKLEPKKYEKQLAMDQSRVGPILIIGHSDTVPRIILELAGPKITQNRNYPPNPIPRDRFGQIWTIADGQLLYDQLSMK